jgi:hypothetical protein
VENDGSPVPMWRSDVSYIYSHMYVVDMYTLADVYFLMHVVTHEIYGLAENYAPLKSESIETTYGNYRWKVLLENYYLMESLPLIADDKLRQ